MQQTVLNKKYNYGILKPNIEIDKKRLNLDYLVGIIHTDGHIRKYNVVICQDNRNYLIAIKEWFNSRGISCSFYWPLNHITCNTKIFKDIQFQDIKDKKSYLAGIIDGDGSFCSHCSDSGKYWRFQIGAKKERKIKTFKMILDYFDFEYLIEKRKSGMVRFTIAKSEEVLRLIKTIKNKTIIKKQVIELIEPKIISFKEARTKKCKYCKKDYQSPYSNHKKCVFVCKEILCQRKYGAARMRGLRKKWRQKNGKVFK